MTQVTVTKADVAVTDKAGEVFVGQHGTFHDRATIAAAIARSAGEQALAPWVEAVEEVVKQGRVGNGSAPVTRSSRVNIPAGVFMKLQALLATRKETDHVG